MAESLPGLLLPSRRQPEDRPSSTSHYEVDIEKSERQLGWGSALRRNHLKLRTKIIINEILPECYLFLTETEFARVKGSPKENNMDQVDHLIEILLTKEEWHFVEFLKALCKHNYGKTAETLADQAGERACISDFLR